MTRKKIRALLLIALLLAFQLAGSPASLSDPLPAALAEPVTSAPAKPLAQDITAQACILINARNGRVLYEKNADRHMAPASTTKIMTCLLALESGDLNRVVTVPESASKAPADSTVVPVYPGEQMPFSDLVYGLMIPSGNDAANAIATLCAGTVQNFVARMNERARDLGMENTHFLNAHGYPASGHYTTARDLAVLTRTALKNASFERVVRARSHTMRATAKRGEKVLRRSYAILDPDSDYYYPYAYGVKTGYSSSSGQCYVGAAEKDGNCLIAVVLHSGLTKPTKWIDAKTLFEYGFAALAA